jgi:hypothetical protein
VLVLQGDLGGALAAYREALDVRRDVAFSCLITRQCSATWQWGWTRWLTY